MGIVRAGAGSAPDVRRGIMTAAGPLVLVVDDDPTARRMLDVRMRALGCQVAMAATGQDALTAVQRDLPAVLLLDLQMPQMDGMEVLRALNREGVDVPTIVITAHGSIETAVEAMKEGAVDFILKPFDPQVLEIAVRRALERRQLLDSNRLFRDAVAARAVPATWNAPAARSIPPTTRLRQVLRWVIGEPSVVVRTGSARRACHAPERPRGIHTPDRLSIRRAAEPSAGGRSGIT